MDEDVIAINIGSDESESLLGVKPLNGSSRSSSLFAHSERGGSPERRLRGERSRGRDNSGEEKGNTHLDWFICCLLNLERGNSGCRGLRKK
mmetsp:Transcript_25474/g.46078  ORF Transcript_25474/g.46078 Transcript_25474/m.46078 type:complete len:91 (+) Transcript_25474:368-640(+)